MDLLELPIMYLLPTIIIGVEFSLVILIVCFSAIAKYFIAYHEKSKQRQTKIFEDMFNDLMQNDKSIRFDDVKCKDTMLEPGLTALKTGDKKYETQYRWKKIRKEFIHSVIFPIARKAATSEHWHVRFFASEAFNLDLNTLNTPYITKLVNDNTPIILFNAILAGIKHRSEEALRTAIVRIAAQTWQISSFYLQAFDYAPIETQTLIESELSRATSPAVRAVCMQILLKFPAGKTTHDDRTGFNFVMMHELADDTENSLKLDLESEYTPVKFAAIRYLAHIKGKMCIPQLLDSIKDNDWRIRSVTLNLLGQLGEETTTTAIAGCLRDESMAVRMAAAKALKQVGKPGELRFHQEQVKDDKDSYNVAHHVLMREELGR